MRIANIDGRLMLATPTGFIDVAQVSDGEYGPDPQSIFEDWAAFTQWSEDVDPVRHQVVEVTDDALWGPPVPRPAQVFAIGLNYREHADEAGLEYPSAPTVFTKFPTSLTGHQSAVTLPEGTVDWEVELVAVIGKRCDNVAESQAWDHIAGLTVGQDLSERQMQLSGPVPQFSLGKSFRGFSPLGPELVTVDELPNRDDLEIGCALEGGETLQKGRTSDLIFNIPQLIAHLSSVCPLLPGDLVFTGTPSGVGLGRKPPKFLQPGDVLVSWIEGIGTLRNPMVAR